MFNSMRGRGIARRAADSGTAAPGWATAIPVYVPSTSLVLPGIATG